MFGKVVAGLSFGTGCVWCVDVAGSAVVVDLSVAVQKFMTLKIPNIIVSPNIIQINNQ